jgi:hypothetical protein
MRSAARRATIAALLFAFASVATVSAASGSAGDHPRSYYVSVGDSLAAGVQPIGDASDLYRTTTGTPSSCSRSPAPTRPSSPS